MGIRSISVELQSGDILLKLRGWRLFVEKEYALSPSLRAQLPPAAQQCESIAAIAQTWLALLNSCCYSQSEMQDRLDNPATSKGTQSTMDLRQLMSQIHSFQIWSEDKLDALQGRPPRTRAADELPQEEAPQAIGEGREEAEQKATPRRVGKSTVRICFEPDMLRMNMQGINSAIQARQPSQGEQDEDTIQSRREILESATALSHDWLLLMEHFRVSQEDTPAFERMVREIEDFQSAASAQLEVGLQA